MILDLHNKLISGEITSVKLTEEYFSAIEKKDSEIGAYLILLKNSALQQAKKADEKIKKGESINILEGIPCAIKDNICVAGERATAGSKILDNYTAPYDATVIKKIKEAGAVILGKTNMDEFAMGASTENSGYQRTKNPVDCARVPGGSSGGSAAAVAGDMAAWGLGSDTGGSVRQPASFCGVVGLKPTYGRISRYGLIAMASSFDQIGPITKTVEDAAIVLSAISGEDRMDSTSAKSGNKNYEDYLSGGIGEIRRMRVGIPKEYLEGLDEKILEKFNAAAEKFKKLGAEISKISLPHTQYALATYYIIMPSEASSNLARFDGIKYGIRINDGYESQSELNLNDNPNNNPNNLPRNLFETYLDTRQYGFGGEVKKRIMLGTYALSAGYYDAYYKKAQKVRALIKNDFEDAFKKVDSIFTPTAPEVAFKFGEKTGDPLKMCVSDIYTVTANLAGVPAISFPIGEIGGIGEIRGLPIGGQLMGKWFDEENMLRAAHVFETT